MDSDDGRVVDATTEIVDTQFESDSGGGGHSASGAGGDGNNDPMEGMCTALNIVDILEVFSPPRDVGQGMKIGLKAGSSMGLLTGWDFELKSDRGRPTKQLEEKEPMLIIGSPPCA